MSAVWLRLRAELRERWRGWGALALLVGAFGGAVGAAAGASRTGSVVERYVEKHRPPDVFLAPAFITGSAEDPKALTKALCYENLIRLPSVAEGASPLILPTEPIEGVDGRPVEIEVLAPRDPAIILPIALIVANLVAALPARSAARTRPALVLRTE